MGQTRPRATEGDVAEVEDRFVARLARSGDTEAFDGLVRRHMTGIYRLCAGMLGAGDDAADAAQETFVRAWQSLPRYEPDRPFGPWLRGIAVKVCQQTLRKRSGDLKRQAPLTGREADTAPADSGESSPLADEVMNALADLDDSYRLPLILFYLRDGSVSEVAQALGLTPGATRVRLHRGREMLKAALGTDESDGTQ